MRTTYEVVTRNPELVMPVIRWIEAMDWKELEAAEFVPGPLPEAMSRAREVTERYGANVIFIDEIDNLEATE